MEPKKIKKLLGSDLAQKDKHFLSYAVDRPDLLEELSDFDNDLFILNSPRGSGKSGLLLSLEKSLNGYSKNYVVIKKYYEEVKFPDGELSLNQHVNFWINSILGWVVSNIGNKKGLAITDDAMTSVELSESHGDRELNLISSVLKRLKFNAMPMEKLDFDPNVNESTLKRIIKKSQNVYWLLLDEMDDLYSNSTNRNNSLVALFQAANFITGQFNNLKVRITIRPHIYTYLKTNFDSIQKLRECVTSISWTEDQLRTILARRVEHYEYGRTEVDSEQFVLVADEKEHKQKVNDKDKDCKLISTYFDDFDMSFKNDKGSDYRVLHTASLGRPRWMIEFCKLALQQERRNKKATTNCFKRAFAEYAENRIDFIAAEYRSQYPFLEAAINSIVSARRVAIGSSKQLRNLIKGRVLNTKIIAIDEEASDEEISKLSLDVAKALYVVEFIRAKQAVGGSGNDHRYYTYSNRPSLLASWNKERNIEWQIHPTFARGLNIVDSQVYWSGGEVRNFRKSTVSENHEET